MNVHFDWLIIGTENWPSLTAIFRALKNACLFIVWGVLLVLEWPPPKSIQERKGATQCFSLTKQAVLIRMTILMQARTDHACILNKFQSSSFKG